MLNSPQRHPEAPAAGPFAPAAGTGDQPLRQDGRSHRARAGRAALLLMQLRAYLGRLGWVARDGASQFKVEILRVVIANILGISTAAMSLGGILLYARHAGGGKAVPIRLGFIHFHLQGDVMSLVLFGGLMAALGIFSGLCMYFTEWQIQRVTRTYQKRCAQRILDIVTDPIHRGWHDHTGHDSWKSIKPMVHIRARWTAFTFQSMLRSILPLFTFLGALAYLANADLRLTLMLVPLAALYLIPLYLINRHVSRNQAEYRRLAPLAQGGISMHLKRQLDTSASPPRKARLRGEGMLDDSYDGMMAAYFNRLIADKRVVLLNTVFFVVCLFVLFVFFGVATNESTRTWAELVSYLVALRFAIGSLRHVSGLFLKFSRYFPEYRAFSRFIEAADEIRARRAARPPAAAGLPERLTIRINDPHWDSPSRLRVHREGVLWVLASERVGHFALEAAAVRLEARCAERPNLSDNAALYAGAALDPDESLLANALGSQADAPATPRLLEALETLGVRGEIDRLPNGLMTTPRQASSTTPISPEANVALHLAPSLLGGPGSLFLAAAALEGLSPPFIARLIAMHRGHGFTVIVDHRIAPLLRDRLQLGDAGISGVLVMDGPSNVGGGDLNWFRAHAGEIEQFISIQRGAPQDLTDADADDNDDDGDDEDDFL